MRWGILSTARINERLIPCIRNSKRSELAAVASRSQERAQQYASEWEIPKAYGSYESLLADPEIEVVYISLPNHMHVDWAVRAADAGKHVLCEKPLALTTAEVDRIADAAARNRVIIQEAAMMRFNSQIEWVRDLIAAGTIGQIRLGRGLFTFTLEREGDVRFDPQMGGGSLWDVGTYCVRWFRTVLQAEPHTVYATRVADARDVDLSLAGQLYFADDVVAHFFSSFASFALTEADLLGSKGRVILDVPWVNQIDQPSHVRWARVGGPRAGGTFGDNVENIETGERTFANVNAYQDEVDSMVSSILDGAPVKIPLTDSRNNTAVVVALLESARQGRPVAVEV